MRNENLEISRMMESDEKEHDDASATEDGSPPEGNDLVIDEDEDSKGDIKSNVEINEEECLSCDNSFGSNEENETEPSPFEEIKENIYLVDRKKSRTSKEARRMKCDCVFEPEDPLFIGCGESCLNRLLMIECTSRCRCGEFCTNKNFQRGTKFKLEVFKTNKKGFGLRTLEYIPKGSFVIEYCGEIVDYSEFMNRTELYEAEGRKHFYFMTLKTNEVIDATKKGAISRFINHSCDPNIETQKWTVYGFLRIGFFSIKDIQSGEELSFDYQFERYGEKAQKCFCGSSNCRGIIGAEKQARMKATFFDRAPLKKKERRKKEDDDEAALDEGLDADLTELLGDQGEIVDPEQVLELTRLMVKVERFPQRLKLLKVLQGCNDSFALKSFVRYNGLSLLWSWMVDATNESTEYKIEIMNTLQHVPIPNKNQLKDSKILQIVQKWAKANGPVTLGKSSPDGEEDGSSNSDAENDIKNGSDSGSQNGENVEESILENEESPEETCSKDSDDTKDDDLQNSPEKKESRKKKDVVASFACGLLENWKSLKEIFKIPKKSQGTPDKRSKGGSDQESCSSPADQRGGKKKTDDKVEERSPKTYSPTVSRADPSVSLFSEPTSTGAGGSSPVLPFLSPIRGAQSKALATNQVKGNTEQEKGRSDEGMAESTTNNFRENRENQSTTPEGEGADLGELWDDLFGRRDSNSGEGGNADLCIDDVELDQDYAETSYRRRWSRWGGDKDNRRPPRFGSGKTFRKKRRRGSYAWEQERHQYAGTGGRYMNREHDKSAESEETYENTRFCSDYINRETDYSGALNSNFESEHDYRPPYRKRPGSDFGIRPSVSLDKYRPPFQKRVYPDNPSQVPNPRITSLQPNRLPRHTSLNDVSGQQTRPQVTMSNQVSDVHLIDAIGQARSGWPGMPSGVTANAGSSLPPPPMPPPFQSQQPPPSQQTFSQLPSSVGPNTPRAPLLQHPVPPPPQIPPPTNPPLNNFGRFGVTAPVTPSVSTPPIVPLPPSSRPVLQDCPTQAPPPRPPSFPVQPSLRFLNSLTRTQQIPPISIAQVPNASGLPLPVPPPTLLPTRLPVPTPLTLAQLPTTLSLQQPPSESLISPAASLSQSRIIAPPVDTGKQLQALMQIKPIVPASLELAKPQLASPPLVQGRSSVPVSTQSVSPINYSQAESSPVSSKPIPPLPQNWKTATDPEGKIYYYHTITRQTQWDPPVINDDRINSMDTDKDYSVMSGPRTPSLSPPHSPITPSDRAGSIMAAADTTVNRHKSSSTHHSHRSTDHLSPRSQKVRDAFKTKLSAVVVNCLNPYQKVDCKQGKITRTEDFKFLARKLTHGLMVKEMARVKIEGNLECNDSVKIKVKEYIRNYMKKFGDVYVRS